MLRRRIIAVVLAVPVVLFLGAEAARWYASTQIVAGLAQQYGGKVEADAARAGWTEVTLRGVRLYDADGQHVVASIASLRLDLTLWDLIRGRTLPDNLLVERPQIKLRFDAASQLLTKLPASSTAAGGLPSRIEVRDGILNVEQEGRPAAEIDGLAAHLETVGEKIELSGRLNNDRWGHWNIAGQFDAKSHLGSITADTKKFAATSALLRDLPLVPASWEKAIDFQATVDAQIAIDVRAADQWPHIHADLQASNASVRAPEAGVEATNISADVVLDDTQLSVRQLSAAVGDGNVTASGEVDLGAQPIRIAMHTAAEHVHLAELAKKWPLPADTDGRISGAADVKLAVEDSQIMQASGTGAFTLADARLAGVVVEPIEIAIKEGVPLPEQQKPAEFIQSHLRLRDAPLRPILEAAAKYTEFEVPDVRGNISADVEIEVPLATVADPATYRVAGTLESQGVGWQHTQLTAVQTRLRFQNWKLVISPMQAQLTVDKGSPAGSFEGRVEAQIIPAGDIEANVEGRDISLELISQVAELPTPLQGHASFAANAAALLDDATKLSAWQTSGRLRLQGVALPGMTIDDVAANFQTANGQLKLAANQVNIAGGQAAAEASIDLRRNYEFDAKFNLSPTEIESLLKLAQIQSPEPIAGRLSVTGEAKGSLRPLNYQASGAAKGSDVQFENWIAEAASAQWQLDERQLTLSAVNVTALGGQLQAEATIPLAPGAMPSAKGSFEHLEVSEVASIVSEVKAPVTGTVSGEFSLSGSRLNALTGEVDLQAHQVSVNQSPPGDLAGKLQIEPDKIEYNAHGDVLSGHVEADGALTRKAGGMQIGGNSGRVLIQHVQLASVVPFLVPHQNLPLSGSVDLNLDYSQTALSDQPTGKGRLSISDLRWQDRVVARRVETDARIEHNELRLPDILVPMGEGELRGDVNVSLSSERTGNFTFSLDRVPANDLLILAPELGNDLRGFVDGQFRGTIGQLITAGGAMGLEQAKAAGVDVSGIRLPMRLTYSPQTGRGELTIEESTLHIGQGRVIAAVRVVMDREISLAGTMRLNGVEVSSLTHGAGEVPGVSSAKVSGNVTFSSSNFRTLNDLLAAFDLNLAMARADSLPVISTLARNVIPMPPSTTFNQGTVRGRLSQGIVEIQKLSLVGNDTRLMADGRATLSGRLDLDLIAQIGQMANQPLQRSLLLRVATPILAAEAAPAALLLRANSLLANQLVYLHVGGTLHSPSVQVRPAPQLQYEALQFFLAGVVNPAR